MTTALYAGGVECLQAIIQHRGYAIVSSSTEMKVGEKIEMVDIKDNTSYLFYVIAATDEKDAIEQTDFFEKFFGKRFDTYRKNYYYRINID